MLSREPRCSNLQPVFPRSIVHTEKTLPQETEVANLLALLPYRLMKYAHGGISEAIHEHLSHTFRMLA